MAADLVHRQVRVIVTGSTPAALAAKSATTNIPIVFNFSSDPVALGLVASLARPGGNLTGVTRLNVELASKQLDLIHEIVPAVTTIALLVNPAIPEISESEQERVKAAARTRGLKLHVVEASDERGIDAAFATTLQLQAGALIISPDAFFSDKSAQLGLLSLRHRVPAIYNYRDFVAAGGLMSYSGSLTDSYRTAALYTGRILNGEKPSNLPVQLSTKLDMFINLKTAKTLGLTIPPSILVSADEVIE
jgi:putative ABC transport system substrate-binding protein